MCQTQESDVLAKYFAAVGMQVETEDDKYDAMYDTYLHESVQDKWDRIMHIPLERNSQSAPAERLSAPNGKFVVN